MSIKSIVSSFFCATVILSHSIVEAATSATINDPFSDICQLIEELARNLQRQNARCSVRDHRVVLQCQQDYNQCMIESGWESDKDGIMIPGTGPKDQMISCVAQASCNLKYHECISGALKCDGSTEK